ncbi:hypothetical protein H696_02067 [Fonticula alba]|uniref:Cystinosin n=1 Tax=Fonticula alba TaxID=691883 RepID=A0A058ZCF5_FONAL|nr:hypothetical protein H696_02067 [Fonticula alba]KCV71117.1 hypothetical protein H696_02067 [Fonticula alba]|eukprot:XP_009494240.1 hypothetical protein H696_02067 [Fonticula alba]
MAATLAALGRSFLATAPDNPTPWQNFSAVIGWTYFAAWSISFYPQLIVNFRRKAVTGLSFDFVGYNILGFFCMTIYNFSLALAPGVREEYADRNNGKEPAVAPNDLAFAIHALVLTGLGLVQIFIFKGGRQRFSRLSIINIVLAVVALSLYALLLGVSDPFQEKRHWLDFLYAASYTKLVISLVKYFPQMILNYLRKSTVGWSIRNVLLDLVGGVLSVSQLIMDCWIAGDWSGITGNPMKLLLGLISMSFDFIFMFQHYVLYRSREDPDDLESGDSASLLRTPDSPDIGHDVDPADVRSPGPYGDVSPGSSAYSSAYVTGQASPRSVAGLSASQSPDLLLKGQLAPGAGGKQAATPRASPSIQGYDGGPLSPAPSAASAGTDPLASYGSVTRLSAAGGPPDSSGLLAGGMGYDSSPLAEDLEGDSSPESIGQSLKRWVVWLTEQSYPEVKP